MEKTFGRAVRNAVAHFFTFNLFWRFICELINVAMVMITVYWTMICLAHGLGRMLKLEFLLYLAIYGWVFVSGIKLQKRKLGKTKLKV